MSIHESVTGQQAPEKHLNPSAAGVLSVNWLGLLQRAREGAEHMQQVAENAPKVGPDEAEVTAEQKRLSQAFVSAQQQQQPQERTHSRAGRTAARYVPQPKKQKSHDAELEL
ncbi:hypothetical protein [Corynebacterium sp.]|uniref:hypothetical protein n=1 Tax=Corynebacterium sp. TaxID=1720 RepID=UPI002648430A|nr:hypothetical protein [Corynebacterium sp.]MDN6136156.1 hypothetical protein [Corynebacterium sp.]MDN6737769.1 hypothetical protein [Corynebacterium sp.]